MTYCLLLDEKNTNDNVELLSYLCVCMCACVCLYVSWGFDCQRVFFLYRGEREGAKRLGHSPLTNDLLWLHLGSKCTFCIFCSASCGILTLVLGLVLGLVPNGTI